MRFLYIIGTVYVVACVALLVGFGPRSAAPIATPVHPVAPPSTTDAAGWFRRIKPFCNTVEVENQLRYQPPPSGWQGTGFAAGCLSLAGKVTRARELILALSDGDRAGAANIVFEIGHPVADAGDDKSAGPIMELVVEFVPNHFMALYHAGASEYALGQGALARRHLTEFLKLYQADDGWTSNARGMLARLGGS